MVWNERGRTRPLEEAERDMLLEKVKEWLKKAKQERDAFNKYVSLFIAYNILYNLY
jgi:hypothetical protein